MFLEQHPHKDVDDIKKASQLSAALPIHVFNIKVPDDGLPSVSDWLTCCISFIFNGSRLAREPIDVNLSLKVEGNRKFDIKKGFTRVILGSVHFYIYIYCIVLCSFIWNNALCKLMCLPSIDVMFDYG